MAAPRGVLERMRAAATMDPAAFVSEILFRAEPFAFRSQPQEYHEFKREVAGRLAVDQDGIELVGSARLGFSLNPDHLLREFSARSDFDVVVVSSVVFDQTWEELLANAASIVFANEDEKRRLRKTRENFFHGYLRPDHVPLATFLGREWFPKLAARFDAGVARRHEVHAWLFKSRVHAESFYAANVTRVQPNIKRMLKLRGDL